MIPVSCFDPESTFYLLYIPLLVLLENGPQWFIKINYLFSSIYCINSYMSY